MQHRRVRRQRQRRCGRQFRNRAFPKRRQNPLPTARQRGAVRALDPARGAIIWEQPLTCLPNGSPTVNARTHVLAVPMYGCLGSAKPGVSLFNATTGTPLRTITTAGAVFAQPVFANSKLFIAF